MKEPDLRQWHDMGGRVELLSDPVIDVLCAPDPGLWEKRVEALTALCTAKGLFTVDSFRRALESKGAESCAQKTDNERWVDAVTQNLIEAGVITVSELRAKIADIEARGAKTYGEAAAS